MTEEFVDSRRKFVAGVSAMTIGAIAGCTGGEDDDSGVDDSDGRSDTTAEAADTSPSTSSDAGTSTEAETETRTRQSFSELSLGEASVVTVDRGHSEEVGGEVSITNDGDAPTGRFGVGLDWLDSDGEYIATSDIYGRALAEGETWNARTVGWLDVEEPEKIDSVEATITEDSTEPYHPPEGVEVASEEFRSSDEEVTFRGTVENGRQSSEFIEVAAKVYDGTGDVIGMDWTIEEVSAGDSWRFEVSPDTYGRNDRADSGTIHPFID